MAAPPSVWGTRGGTGGMGCGQRHVHALGVVAPGHHPTLSSDGGHCLGCASPPMVGECDRLARTPLNHHHPRSLVLGGEGVLRVAAGGAIDGRGGQLQLLLHRAVVLSCHSASHVTTSHSRVTRQVVPSMGLWPSAAAAPPPCHSMSQPSHADVPVVSQFSVGCITPNSREDVITHVGWSKSIAIQQG